MKRETKHIRFFFAAVMMCVLTVSASAQSDKKDARESAKDSESHHHTAAAQAQDAQKGEKQFLGKGDGIETCPVMGGAVDKDMKFEWKGQTYYVCCPGCIDILKKDPELYLRPPKKEGAEHQEHQGHQDSGDQAKPAGESKFLGKGDGIETCPVTGEPVNKDFKEEILGRTVYVCCPGCLETIKKNPELYLKRQQAGQ